MDTPISSAEEIIEAARNGHMVILVDDEDRENEGDLVIPAQMATPEAINFMARFGRGLICLALPRQRVENLGLPLLTMPDDGRRSTAFTVSIEAREGISTGISAADRARTIQVAIDSAKTAADLSTPGHVFPLAARDGGVLVRAGHTEAAVDIARLAGLNPSGVICEIMNDDGTMARLPDLIGFSQLHGIKLGTIADLIAYRRRTEKLVEKIWEEDFISQIGGKFRLMIYANTLSHAEHVVLTKGDISGAEPVLVRMHSVNLLDDILMDQRGGAANLHLAMQKIAEVGRGAIVLIRETSPNILSQRLKQRQQQQDIKEHHFRDYGVGAQILADLGINNMILLSGARKNIVGLDAFGLQITGFEALQQDE
ncbi:MAG: 3,4-dihydroxy-2-butanone-4-phosphate synthase [Alphaproteobacteria bacterium]